MLFSHIASLFLLVGTASALDPRTVSPCLRKCSITGALAANCKSPLDLKCVCGAGKNAYQGGAAPCIIADCPDQLSGALNLSAELCKEPLGSAIQCPSPADGWSMCGDICIDHSLQTCSSGVPINHLTRRRSLTICEPHQRMCQVGQLFGAHKDQAGYECLDVLTNLEACGGCPGEGGVDCTALYGVADVSCRKGRCHVEECEEGLTLSRGRCK